MHHSYQQESHSRDSNIIIRGRSIYSLGCNWVIDQGLELFVFWREERKNKEEIFVLCKDFGKISFLSFSIPTKTQCEEKTRLENQQYFFLLCRIDYIILSKRFFLVYLNGLLRVIFSCVGIQKGTKLLGIFMYQLAFFSNIHSLLYTTLSFPSNMLGEREWWKNLHFQLLATLRITQKCVLKHNSQKQHMHLSCCHFTWVYIWQKVLNVFFFVSG